MTAAVTESTRESVEQVESRNTESVTDSTPTVRDGSTVTDATQHHGDEVDRGNASRRRSQQTLEVDGVVVCRRHRQAVPCADCAAFDAWLDEQDVRHAALVAKRAPRFAKYREQIAHEEAEREQRRMEYRAEHGDEKADGLEAHLGAVERVLGPPPADADEIRLLRRLANDAARTAECCGHCGVDIGPGEKVYRRRLNIGYSTIFNSWSWAVAPVCGDCQHNQRARRALECRGCGRRVVDQFHTWAVVPFCCQRCRWTYGNRERAAERDARPCESCGEMFTGRTDSKFCSNACRQRAYRIRKAVR